MFGYTGRPLDGATGLYNYRERWYGPSIGRFWSEDPAESDWNLYVYCGNNPVNNTDPSGMCSQSYSNTNVSLYDSWSSSVGLGSYSSSSGYLSGYNFPSSGSSSINLGGAYSSPMTSGTPITLSGSSAGSVSISSSIGTGGYSGYSTTNNSLQSPAWEFTKTLTSTFVNEIYDGVKALVTGEAGRALGERAVGIVQTQTGTAFTGSFSDWAQFGRGIVGDLVGVNSIVEAGYGFDISNQQQLDAWQRGTRAAAGISALSGTAAGGLSAAAKAPTLFPTAARAAGVTAETTLESAYKLALESSKTDVKLAHRTLYDAFKEAGGKIILNRSKYNINLETGNQILGKINSLEKTITLFKDSNLGTLSEELIHFGQLSKRGLFGKLLDNKIIQQLEIKAKTVLKQWGYNVSKK